MHFKAVLSVFYCLKAVFILPQLKRRLKCTENAEFFAIMFREDGMVDVFYVEYKDDSGDWQPLGVMTMKEAIQWSWENDHRAVNILHIGDAASD